MSTTSTVPAVKSQLVAKLDEALDVPVTYAWPGSSTMPECVFLGPHPELADIRLDLSSEVPTIKAGRKQRQEDYLVRVTVWEFRPDLTSDGAEECEAQAFVIAGHIEDVLANDPRIGLDYVQSVIVESLASTLFPFQKGWACELAIDVRVRARLT